MAKNQKGVEKSQYKTGICQNFWYVVEVYESHKND